MNEELRISGGTELPKALERLEEQILRTLAIRRREAAVMRRILVAAAYLSMTVGFTAGSIVPRSVTVAGPFSSFAPPSVLTPAPLARRP